jgi:xylulokinase
VEGFIKQPLGAINVIGGGAKSAVWCQIQADVLGKPIRQMADPIQANARGAAILAAVAMGFGTFEEIAGKIPVARTFQPVPERRVLYGELFAEFVRLYGASKSAHARLNRRA